MPVDVAWERKGVLVNYTGTVTTAELRNAYDVIKGDARFDGIHYEIYNMLGVDEVDIGVDDVERFSHLEYAASLTNQKIMQVTITDNEELRALTAFYESLTPYEGGVRCVFTMEEARALVQESL